MFARVIRQCPNEGWCSSIHTWEVLNPATGEPFKRGRVGFFCDRNMSEPIPTIERMRMLRR